MASDKAMVIFQPSGRRGEVPKGINLIEASRLLGVDIEALCGEKKVFDKCIVRIEEGHFEKFGVTSSMKNVSPWQEEEDKFITPERREKGFRLGCVPQVQGDLLVFVPEESRAGKQVVSKAARDIHIEHNPAVNIYYVEVDPPSFEEPTADYERVCLALERDYGLQNLTVDIFTLRTLPTILRDGDWKVTVSVWNDKEIIRFRPGKAENAYGLAIDVGTTTVAAYFCNLTTMEVVDTVSMMNPQCKYGEDVMARITFHMTTPDGLKRMSDDIIEGLNELIDQAIANTYPPKKKKPKMKDETGPREYVEVPEEGKTYLRLSREDIEDITIGFNISQKDVRQIQLAKGALYAGCKLMVKRMGLEKVDKVKIAGAFGTHVDRTKALIMGLFPDCEIEMIQSVGNAAGDGCRAALLNTKKRVEANWCSRNVEYIELTVESTFQKDFMEAMQLPHMTDAFPHLRGIVPDEILDQ